MNRAKKIKALTVQLRNMSEDELIQRFADVDELFQAVLRKVEADNDYLDQLCMDLEVIPQTVEYTDPQLKALNSLLKVRTSDQERKEIQGFIDNRKKELGLH